jgi:hypothetical protein
MDIDWDKAPELATHYCKLFAGFRGHGDSLCSHCIPRPSKKAQEAEWDGTAFPIPAGAKCEVQMGSFWYPGTVIASTAEAAWFKADQNGEFWTIMNGLSIRPIRTKEQRLRDELVECIAATPRKPLKEIDGYDIADHLISEGWIKEPKP